MSRTLLVIDIQNDYFPGGAYPLVGADEAARAASRVLAGFRERSAAERGYDVQVVHDACAAPDLALGGTTVPGALVHAAFIAALGDSFATVVAAHDLT